MTQMNWRGFSRDDYERLHENVKWRDDIPSGLLSHAASFDEWGAHIVDCWDSETEFKIFFKTRLGPGFEDIGAEGMPDAKVYPLSAWYVPGQQQIFSRNDSIEPYAQHHVVSQ